MLVKLDGIEDIQEALQCPESAYSLACIKAAEHKKDGKVSSIQMIWQIEGEDREYANLFYYMALPQEGDDEDKAKFKMLMIKRVLFYTDNLDIIESGTLDTAALIGSRTTVAIPVKIDPPTVDNNEREGRNIIWPNLPQEVE